MSEENLKVIESQDDQYHIPLDCLSDKSFSLLCSAMNLPSKKMFSLRLHADQKPSYCSADVQGFVRALGYGDKEDTIIKKPSPMSYVMTQWSHDHHNKRSYTMGTLIELLYELERYDVLFELTSLLEADISAWKAREKRMQEKQDLEEKLANLSISDMPKKIQRLNSVPEFDAVFFFDTRSPFAEGIMMELHDLLTKNYHLRLCKGIEEDMLPGDLKTSSFMNFMDTRWRRVIVLLTKNYLNSPQLKQQLHSARIKGIEEQYKRKVVPVEAEAGIQMPSSLTGIISIRYFRTQDRKEHLDSIYRAIKSDE